MYININSLRVYAFHGVHPEEKQNGQDFVLDISCLVSNEAACIDDSVGSTVSYSDVTKKATEIFLSDKFDLIEFAAARVADGIISSFPLVDEVIVTVRKPNAPVKAEFENMSVTVTRKKQKTENGEKTAYLAFGSNIGDGRKNITDAYTALNLVPGVRIVRKSDFYITKPWGYSEQADFTNSCAEIKTTLTPEALLGVCLGIEAGFGRIREFRNGPRILDIDLLMYEGETRNTHELTLPHPGMCERDFVLLPLNDLAENGKVLGVDIGRMIDKLKTSQ